MSSRLSVVLWLGVAFLLGTLLRGSFPWTPAAASPADVRGSDNVLVCGYRNRAGSFLLWSSGRITRPDGTQANAAGRYMAAPGYSRPDLVARQPVGSGNVACGTVPDGSGTYVVFSDGSVRRPAEPGAAAAPLDQRVVWGFVEAGPTYGQGSGDWSVGLNDNRTFHVSFDPPFQSKPAVVTGGSSGAYRLANVSGSGFDLYDMAGHAPDAQVPFTFVASGR